MKGKGIFILLLGIIMIATIVNSEIIEDNSESEFGNGTYTRTFYNSTEDAIQLNLTYNNGTYLSQIFDSNTTGTAWDNISWVSNTGELLDNEGVDKTINMSGNILLLHMNEKGEGLASGNDVRDFSGYNHHGNQSGGITYNATGRFNTSIDFDGVDDYINITDSTDFDNFTEFTFGAWVYPEEFMEGQTGIISKKINSSSTGGSYALKFRALSGGTGECDNSFADADIRFMLATSNYRTVICWGNLSNYLDGWHHIAGRWNGTNVTLFWDGVPRITYRALGDLNVWPDEELTVGYMASSGAEYFNGSMDEVFVFANRSLTDSEIKDIYHRGSHDLKLRIRSCNDAACDGEHLNLVNEYPNNAADGNGWIDMTSNTYNYHMDESSGTIIDWSGAGHNATENGGVTYGVEGKLGEAIRFDGSNDEINMSTQAHLTEATIAFWFNPDDTINLGDTSDRYGLLTHDAVGDDDGGFDLAFGLITTGAGNLQDGKLHIRLQGGGASNEHILSSSTSYWEAGKWYHVAITKTGGNFSMYINSEMENSTNTTRGIFSGAETFIGKKAGTSASKNFDGIIDEFAIWERALSYEEINDLYYTQNMDNIVSPIIKTPARTNKYFQYEFDFGTENQSFTPYLYNVTIGYTLSPDLTNPNVTLNSPAHSSTVSTTSSLFNCTAVDETNLSSVRFYGNFTGAWVLNSTNSSGINGADYLFTASFPEGIYVWNCEGCDTSDNCAFAIANYTLNVVYPGFNFFIRDYGMEWMRFNWT
jgi:hypothetical protein